MHYFSHKLNTSDACIVSKRTLLTLLLMLLLWNTVKLRLYWAAVFTLDFSNHYFSRNSTHAAVLVTHIQLRVTKPVVNRPPHCTGSLIGSRRGAPRVLRAFSTSFSLPAFYFIPQCTRARLDSESHILRPKVLIPVRSYSVCLPH